MAILRAADEIIGRGGRSLLSKILKGSKDKKVIELGLDQCPAYGALRSYTLEQITDKIDLMINTGLLDTELNWKNPVIVFTPLGWFIERERMAEELLREWDEWLANDITPVSMEYLKDRNRGMILLLLYKVLRSGDSSYIPLLRLWEPIDYRKVRVEINHVIHALERRESMDGASWNDLVKQRVVTLLPRGDKPIVTVCHHCDGIIFIDEHVPELYDNVPLKIPEACVRCLDKMT